MATVYYAAYVVSTMLLKTAEVSRTESAFHLAWWTLVPPSWFFFEWFVLFDNHASDEATKLLQAAQGLAGRFWASVLALIVSLKVADIIAKT